MASGASSSSRSADALTERLIDTASPAAANMGADLKDTVAPTKVKASTLRSISAPSHGHIADRLHSHAAYAQIRKRSETNACFFPPHPMPQKNAPAWSTNIASAWLATASRSERRDCICTIGTAYV
ncbi:hypothetical protein J1614_002665 [Plenodomus biglobosus]|nr:hypothetical protein J1614_002665 [Plenodomus biglobosus]